jgi:hypothetical protein
LKIDPNKTVWQRLDDVLKDLEVAPTRRAELMPKLHEYVVAERRQATIAAAETAAQVSKQIGW